jgi:hypothetical protein
MSEIEQELNGLGMGDIWRNRGDDDDDDDDDVWREVSKRCVDTDWQKMEGSIKNNK